MQSSSHKRLLADAKLVITSHNSGDAIKKLAEKNEDIKGWLRIEGTSIDCAVCQGDDNTFYINHNQLGKKSRYGALFLSQNDSFERVGDDHNIVIFGNNMKDGTMFGSLKKYRNLNFYKQNPFVELYFDNEIQKYLVFSVMLISSSVNDSGEIYKPYKSHFTNENDFKLWAKETASRSLINTTVSAEYGDDILTLVTVADDFDGARLVVMAKKLTDWDMSHTDVSQASVNSKIKYPKIWYTTRGLEYPY
ncbi:MAG: class B sortase [Clostridia bacterium]|nr:class B sortase [Clostridia bacterium]